MSKEHPSGAFVKVVGSVIAVGLVSLLVWYQGSNERITDREKNQQRRPSTSQERAAVNNPDFILLELFQQSCKKANSLSLSNGDKLMLYGLYKQATVGDTSDEKKPSRLNLIGTAKHQAWMQFISMPKKAAMMHYIQAVGDLESTTIESNDDEQHERTTMGLKPSTMIQEPVRPLDVSASLEEQLRRAASEGAYETMVLLLNANIGVINVNQSDVSGQTALHFCADRGHMLGVQLLLKNGALVDATDHDGISVLQAAVIAGHVDICSLLLHHGADPDHFDADGDSPRSCIDEEDEDMMALFQVLTTINEE